MLPQIAGSAYRVKFIPVQMPVRFRTTGQNRQTVFNSLFVTILSGQTKTIAPALNGNFFSVFRTIAASERQIYAL